MSDGPSLAELLEEDGAPDFKQAEEWFTAIVGAVKYAHARGLVHRDLKPDNVLMAPMSGGYLVKVTDFGIAKVVQEYMDEKSHDHKTRTNTGMGTPAYMPPEQVTNAGQVDHRADIFALGCILYELVTGRRAFAGENLLSIYNAAAEGDYEPPGMLVSDLPDRVVAAIEGCLEPNPDQRIPTCSELMEVFSGKRVVTPKTPAPRGERTSRLTKPSDPLPIQPAALPKPPPKKAGWFGTALVGTVLSVAGVVIVVGFAIVIAVMYWTATRPVSTTQPWTYSRPSAMGLFEVTMHGYTQETRLENGVMTYEAGSPDSALYVFDMEVNFLGDDTAMPGAPWALVEEDGLTHDADMACGMAIRDPIQPFRMFNQGERVRGPICFEAPRDAKGLRLRFKPDPIHGASFWFDVE